MPRNTSAGVQRVDVDGPPMRVWHLGYVDALRLTPGATVTIRNWRWSVVPHTDAAFTFASEERGLDREAAELKLDVLCTDIRDVGAAGLPKEE